MPILSKIGRRTWSGRSVVIGIYVVLILGGITQIYPFLMMVSGSLSGGIDYDEFGIVPAYIYSDLALYRRYLYIKYMREPGYLRNHHQVDYRLDEEGNVKLIRRGIATSDFKEALPPSTAPDDPRARRRVADYEAVIREATHPFFRGAFFAGRGTRQEELNFVTNRWIAERYRHDVELYNRRHGEFVKSFVNVAFPFHGRMRMAERSCRFPLAEPFFEIMELNRHIFDHHPRLITLYDADVFYRRFLEQRYGGIDRLNAAYGTRYESFLVVQQPDRLPEADPARTDWADFMKSPRTGLPFWYMRLEVTPDLERRYREFVRGRYPDIEALSRAYAQRSLVRIEDLTEPAPVGAVSHQVLLTWCERLETLGFPGFSPIPRADYRSFDEVELSSVLPDPDYVPRGEDWRAFVEEAAPAETLVAAAPGNLYRAWLRNKYGTIEALNEAYGTAFARFVDVLPPNALRDWLDFNERKGWYRNYFLYRNYRQVFESLSLVEAPVFRNTLFLCVSMIALALTINPLCAFALSRFGLSYTYKVLLFCLATMAFPAEVTMIPNFLLIKDLGLLNTYWALVLPAAANGFSIFLLKGFFDSLPHELYETAVIEGCGELRMFWLITVPLSKPIFAVIALSTFMAAYGSFLWALVVCQKPSKWTLMVWLYQYQQIYAADVVMAALVLAAIPTLIVFIAAQKVIMRGIIIPTFK